MLVRCALTLDDAPIMVGSRLQASPLDAVREALARVGVKRCVAFVIGDRVPGHEAALVRWLEAGFELGNHTSDHAFASRTTSAAFLAAVERCDAVLSQLGAFDGGRARYLRYPYGDRGASAEQRGRNARAVRDLGYRIADVSLSLHDHCYEGALEAASARGDATGLRAIEQRFLAHVATLPERARALATPPDFVHVVGGHFGRAAQGSLEVALRRIQAELELCGLEEAVGQPTFQALHDDPQRNGVAEDVLSLSLRTRLLRRAARFTRARGWLSQRHLGPLWPHLSD